MFQQAFEDIYLSERPRLKTLLDYLNVFFAVVFTVEFLLKILGLGFLTYVKNFWNCLDVFIVAVSIVICFSWIAFLGLRILRQNGSPTKLSYCHVLSFFKKLNSSAITTFGTIDLMQIWRLLISINSISSIKEMNPITRKSMSTLVMQPSFRAVGQTHAEW